LRAQLLEDFACWPKNVTSEQAHGTLLQQGSERGPVGFFISLWLRRHRDSEGENVAETNIELNLRDQSWKLWILGETEPHFFFLRDFRHDTSAATDNKVSESHAPIFDFGL
jgi:hypothetical protein